ncbi:NACHT domain-containing protein [Streptomyces sp. YC504]|uniref:NACHT domain-containing protein n=1 Tax=Streptomyces mesophilus TaxID=1775132 RepID=A0A6G4XFF1_9ACTN|nr:NACHT domain-containing protein [Streptomyces mesophilus]NGO75580.1 NACHT domain-containing protein [Streptomyces mesophilus]
MTATTGLSPGRQLLRDALRELESQALLGRDRTDAIAEANRRLRSAGHGEPLGPTRVGGWFEKGSPAKDFELLWVLVQVLLEWGGLQPPGALAGRARPEAAAKWTHAKELWKSRWESARKAARNVPEGKSRPALTPTLDGYLRTVRVASRQHPYPGASVDRRLPALSDVYVRQRAFRAAADDEDQPRADGPTGNTADSPTATATDRVVSAEAVFRTGKGISVLVGDPGCGKTTLLRAYLTAAATSWLDLRRGGGVPVMIRAHSLTAGDPMPVALARAANADLAPFGLLDELTSAFFREVPHEQTPWLVLVDGLDEISDAGTRQRVITMLDGVVRGNPHAYRFVVATRSLPEHEVYGIGTHVPRFELLPFSAHDLLTYAEKWFRHLEDAARHARLFVAGLSSTRLEGLACTPLMASMLCQLYEADPARPLPEGRTGAYRSFAELIYEKNTHKQIKRTHDEAIRQLRSHHQVPRDDRTAEEAAELVRGNLPELIDNLAFEWIEGNDGTATDVLATHFHVRRPAKVSEQLWNEFLSDLLRPTGLLTQRGDDFGFLHQTLMEYHAARHATRSKESREQVLRRFQSDSNQLLSTDASYLGFLLDGLLMPQDRIAAATTELLRDGLPTGLRRLGFLRQQLRLRTSLPPDLIAAQLISVAEDRGSGTERLEAVGLLLGMTEHHDKAIDVLIRLCRPDANLSATYRLAASALLAAEKGSWEQTLQLAARLALEKRSPWSEDPLLGAVRVLAAMEWGRDAAAGLAVPLVRDTTVRDSDRFRVVMSLAGVAGPFEETASLLRHLALDGTVGAAVRLDAAAALARENGRAKEAATLMVQLAESPTVKAAYRLRAAGALAQVDGYRGAAPLAGHQEQGAALLARLAQDDTLDATYRPRAAVALSRVQGHRVRGALLLKRLADDGSLSPFVRMHARAAFTRLMDQ